MTEDHHQHPRLSTSDALVLRAAWGWLELGDFESAFEETADISPEYQNHPEVLRLRFDVYAKRKSFDACRETGVVLMEIAPAWAQSVLCYCRSVHWLGKSEEAYQLMSKHTTELPSNWEMVYDLACYAAMTERLAEAKQLLQSAYALVPDSSGLRAYALQDPDLESIARTD